MGCKIDLVNGNVEVDAEAMRGADVFLGGRYGSTVTGTANILMAAARIPDTTVVECAACEPEVVDLCHLLVKMGVGVEGIGSPRLVVHGQERLKGFDHTVIGDRVEAGTFLIAGVLTNGHLRVDGCEPSHLGALIHLFNTHGCPVDVDNGLTVYPNRSRMEAFELTTLPYPGFATDLQAQMCVLASVTPGLSLITEKVYPNRFMHVPELERLGAHIILEGPTAIIRGAESRLRGANIMASDLRASAALYLAGLIADGTTTVHRIYHVDRGYERFDQKLSQLGAVLERLAEEELRVPAS
jgi:UDP-N-acetylglucosamine 1-carboxyvinyltransferase